MYLASDILTVIRFRYLDPERCIRTADASTHKVIVFPQIYLIDHQRYVVRLEPSYDTLLVPLCSTRTWLFPSQSIMHVPARFDAAGAAARQPLYLFGEVNFHGGTVVTPPGAHHKGLKFKIQCVDQDLP